MQLLSTTLFPFSWNKPFDHKVFPLKSVAYRQSTSLLIASHKASGLTLVEVLVAALVMSLLLFNLLALISYASMFTLKARQSSVARAWIQEDLENIKFDASQFSVAHLINTAAAGDTSVTLNRVAVGGISLELGDRLKLGTEHEIYTISSISGTTISFTPGLKTSQPSNTKVLVMGASSAPKFCNATSSSTSLAQALASDLAPVMSSSKDIAGTSYTLNRSAIPIDNAPYQRLEMTYTVLPSGGGTAILSMQTQVLPDVAFNCP